jgi:hypothetical protein
MAAAAVPRALTLTRARRRAAGPKISTDPGPNPATVPAAPRGSAARGHIGDRHPALPSKRALSWRVSMQVLEYSLTLSWPCGDCCGALSIGLVGNQIADYE